MNKTSEQDCFLFPAALRTDHVVFSPLDRRSKCDSWEGTTASILSAKEVHSHVTVMKYNEHIYIVRSLVKQTSDNEDD